MHIIKASILLASELNSEVQGDTASSCFRMYNKLGILMKMMLVIGLMLFLGALCTKLSMNTYQKALRMAAVADRTAGFPLFSSLLSVLQCDRYRETKIYAPVRSKISDEPLQ